MLKKMLAKKKVTNIGVAELKITAILIVNTAPGVTGFTAILFCMIKLDGQNEHYHRNLASHLHSSVSIASGGYSVYL